MLERTVRTLHMLEKDKKSPIDRIVILNKEIAQVAYELLQCKIFPGEENAHMANAMLELGDAMVQIEMLCHDLQKSPEEIKNLGIRHTFERFQDFEERGWNKNTPAKTGCDVLKAWYIDKKRIAAIESGLRFLEWSFASSHDENMRKHIITLGDMLEGTK